LLSCLGMKRLASLLLAGSLFAPLTALAATPDYAKAVTTVSNQVFQPANALGSPDGAYADFLSKDATITLDLGADTLGTGDLTLTLQLLNFGAQDRLELFDADMNLLATDGGTIPTMQPDVVMSYSGAPYRYVRITSLNDDQWKLDAVRAAGTASSAPAPANPPPTSPTQPGIPRGLLVKLPDDGNPATDVDAAVYEIGADGKRHAFPTLSTYASWYPDFDAVTFIDATNLASYPLGGNVTVRPGTSLVKITADPKVYAVAPGSVLRWIPSESVATALYGADWAKRVIDIPDVFFHNYVVGPDLNDQAQPDGTVGPRPDGSVVYVKGATTHAVPDATAFAFRSDFYAPISARLDALYAHDGDLTDQDVKYPY
jgi:hypothetical protein